MVTCIVLDGWHKGHTVQLPEPLQQIRLLRPPVKTYDDCCEGDVVSEVRNGYHDYELAFAAVDRKTFLYTQDGSSAPIMQRDWIGYGRGREHWATTPLYVGIHDPRSVASVEEKQQ
jgi:hypothetical protein